MNTTKFTNEELICKVCEKNNFRNSQKNHEKLENCGIKSGEPIDLGNNCSMVFTACHDGIYKKFFWGTRAVTRKTAQRRCAK